MKDFLKILALMLVSLSLFFFLNTNTKLSIQDLKAAHIAYAESVYDLTWACLCFEKRKTGPLSTEDILRVFDHRSQTYRDIFQNIVYLKELEEKLSKDPQTFVVKKRSEISKTKREKLSELIDSYNSQILRKNNAKKVFYNSGLSVNFDMVLDNPFKKPDEKKSTPIDKREKLWYFPNNKQQVHLRTLKQKERNNEEADESGYDYGGLFYDGAGDSSWSSGDKRGLGYYGRC